MGLVAHGDEDAQGGRVLGQDYRFRPAGQVDLLVLLREARQVGVDAEGVEDLLGRRDLARAAVDEDEVGQIEALVDEARVAAGDGLADGAEVVDRALEALYLEIAVVFLVGHAVLEADEGRNGVLAGELRDVEALDAGRQGGEAELLAQLLEGRYVAQLAAALGEVLPRVLRREVHRHLMPLLRGQGEGSHRLELAREVLGHRIDARDARDLWPRLGHGLEKDLGRRQPLRPVVAHEEALEGLALGGVELAAHEVPARELALAHLEDDVADDVAIGGPGDVVARLGIVVDGAGAAGEELDGVRRVAEPGRLLEAQSLRGRGHLRPELC